MMALLYASVLWQGRHPTDLLDHMVGHWTLKGTIAGKATVHHVDAEWVLRGGYIQIHEVSDEKNAKGEPAYEAIVLIGSDAKAHELTLLWLDTTSSAGLTGRGLGRGKPTVDSLPFIITVPGSRFHTTFKYDAKSDAWKWLMDDETKGKFTPFARVTLTRNK